MTADQRRWRLDCSYDGRGFHGVAAQPGQATVIGAIAGALATVLRLESPPAMTCAGRTDSGVHALGQVLHVDLPDPPFSAPGPDDARRLLGRLNGLVGPDVVITACAPAPAGFDARRSARSRRYRYLVHEADEPSPLLVGLAWHRHGPLDDKAMAQAAYALLGEHDFAAFCRRPAGVSSPAPLVRRVLDVSVREVDEGLGLAGRGRVLRLEVRAQAFCQQMVRSIAATLVAVGESRATAADLVQWLRAGRRDGLPAPAPPEGLCLLEVEY